MALQNYSVKLAALQGGEDTYSLFNYTPPRWNPEAKMIEMHWPMNNYTGPYTDIERRWAREKLHGTNPVDEQARHHDIQYRNLGVLRAQNRISDAQLAKGIKNSDQQLTNIAKKNILSLRPFTGSTALAAYTGIKAKRGLQDMGVMSKTAFVSANSNRPFISEDKPELLPTISPDYLQQGGKAPKKKDRLHKLKKALTS